MADKLPIHSKRILKIETDVINPTFWERILLKYGWMQPVQVFTLYPAKLATTQALLYLFEKSGIYKHLEEKATDELLKAIAAQRKTVAHIIAIAINNRGKSYSCKTRRFILRNCSNEDMMPCLYAVQVQMEVNLLYSAIYNLRTLNSVSF